jgi:hypothetical protein
VRDYERLADLSHTIDRAAVALCREDADDRRIELALVEMADGEREAAAVALSYALRRRQLEGSTPLNDRVIAALAGAVRRMTSGPPPGDDPNDDRVR